MPVSYTHLDVYKRQPALLWQENISVLKAARDFYSTDLDSVVVNDKETYDLLAATGDFSGEGQPKLELYEEKTPLFASFYAESKLEKALSQKVWLKSGGYLAVSYTHLDVYKRQVVGRPFRLSTIQLAMALSGIMPVNVTPFSS